ncbi:unnamed protein product [Phytomonas sp. EM1]|nr:unnamed protein product [Phytomonas sp. EM1]|eukprot:CCW61636.1 unnamed protein product [Phytomonas sp. isolate EM1]
MSVTISLQCSEGRFELPIDSALSVKDVKEEFKKGFALLSDLNLSLLVINYKGEFIKDENVSLVSLGIQNDDVLFLIKKRAVPSLAREDAE